MGQGEIIAYLKLNKKRDDITIKELVIHTKISQSGVNRLVKTLRKYDEVSFRYKGQKILLKYKEEE